MVGGKFQNPNILWVKNLEKQIFCGSGILTTLSFWITNSEIQIFWFKHPETPNIFVGLGILKNNQSWKPKYFGPRILKPQIVLSQEFWNPKIITGRVFLGFFAQSYLAEVLSLSLGGISVGISSTHLAMNSSPFMSRT